MYNPAQPVGQRWSGLLADGTFDRLYHSEAYLTTNADVSPCLLPVFVVCVFLTVCAPHVLALDAREMWVVKVPGHPPRSTSPLMLMWVLFLDFCSF